MAQAEANGGEERGPGSRPSELVELVRLAPALVVSFAGNQLMGLVDTAMVGRLGSVSLAGVGIGNGLFFSVSIAAMGLVLGADPLVAQALGAGERERARGVLRQALWLAGLATVPIAGAILALSLALESLGIPAATAEASRLFLWGRIGNVPPLLLFTALRAYLSAAGATRPVMLAMVVSNVVNLALNWLFIYGDGGLVKLGLPAVGMPALGVLGAGLASSCASFASLATVALGLRAVDRDEGRRAAPVGRGRGPDGAALRAIVRVGAPIALQLLAEVGAFTVVGLLAGRMGATAAAGHQVALTLASMSFMFPLGIASATTILVGRAVGRQDPAATRRAGFVGLGFGLAVMSLAAALFFAVPRGLARLLTDKADVLEVATPLMLIAAVFQLFDGAQVVGAGALRGCGDTRFVQWANVVGHYLVGLPVAVALGFGLGMGPQGLWWGLSAGLVSVSVALAVRFERLSRRVIARL